MHSASTRFDDMPDSLLPPCECVKRIGLWQQIMAAQIKSIPNVSSRHFPPHQAKQDQSTIDDRSIEPRGRWPRHGTAHCNWTRDLSKIASAPRSSRRQSASIKPLLAQLGRSNLARDFAQRMGESFAQNVDAALRGSPALATGQGPIGAFALAWQVLAQRVRALLRKILSG
jgi:hypothetical protein